MNDFRNGLVLFDDMLFYKQKAIDTSFTEGRRINIDIHFFLHHFLIYRKEH